MKFFMGFDWENLKKNREFENRNNEIIYMI